MKRHIPGLHSVEQRKECPLAGFFLVRVVKVLYRWHPEKPFLVLQLAVLEPKAHEDRAFSARLYCTQKALWKLNWFLRDFGYDPKLLQQDQIDEKALAGLRGIVRTSLVTMSGRPFQNLEAFAPEAEWDALYCDAGGDTGESGEQSGFQLHPNQ